MIHFKVINKVVEFIVISNSVCGHLVVSVGVCRAAGHAGLQEGSTEVYLKDE